MNFSEHVKENELSLKDTRVNINQLISFLQENKNITELSLKNCDIGDEGAKALANGNLTNLTRLFLMRSNIGDAGVKALANGNLTNLIRFCCSGDNFGAKEAKALAESGECCEFIDKFASTYRNNITGLCYHLKNLWSQAREESNGNVSKLDKKVAKDFFFYLAEYNYPKKEVIEPFLDDFNKYPFLINSRDEQGHTLAHFYTHDPEMQKFFFERGMIPEKRNQEREDKRIAQDNQSVHKDLIVERTKFFTKKLIECTEASEKKLKQAVSSYVESIKLFQEYQNDTIRLRLLDLNDDNKKSVMEETLGNNPVPDDKEFIQIVIDTAKNALETKYLRKNASGEYDEGYPTYEMEYEDKAKVTIPESIGYIKLMIDNFSIPLEEKKELLVTLIEQNPELVRKKIPIIRKELGNSNILNEAQFEKKELYILLNSIDDSKKIDKLFKEISDLDVENIWREQKEFALLKHIYMAATGYRGKSVCPQGTWTQIIQSIEVINTEIMEQFDLYLEEKEKREAQADIITKENIVPFIENLADRLIQYVKDNPELKEVLQNHLLHCECINIDDPEKVTFKQQKILAEINKYFSENIKGFLPNYNRNIPNRDEYRIIIAGLSKVPVLQNFALVDQGLSDAEDKSNNYITISTDEELLDDVDQELFKFPAEEIETQIDISKTSMDLFTRGESNSRTTDAITNFSTAKTPALEQESDKNEQATTQLTGYVIQEDFIQVLQPKSLVNIRDNNVQLVNESDQPIQGDNGIALMDDSYDAVESQDKNSEGAQVNSTKGSGKYSSGSEQTLEIFNRHHSNITASTDDGSYEEFMATTANIGDKSNQPIPNTASEGDFTLESNSSLQDTQPKTLATTVPVNDTQDNTDHPTIA